MRTVLLPATARFSSWWCPSCKPRVAMDFTRVRFSSCAHSAGRLLALCAGETALGVSPCQRCSSQTGGLIERTGWFNGRAEGGALRSSSATLIE